MTKNIEVSWLEDIRYPEIKESHDDSKLAGDLENITKLIHDNKITKAKDQLEKYVIDSLYWKINLKSIIMGIDFQNRPRNWRISIVDNNSLSPEGMDRFQILIKNNSNLAKIVQLYITISDASIQQVNGKVPLSGVNGNIERFTMQWLSVVREKIRTQQSLDMLRSEAYNNSTVRPLKSIATDLDTTLRNTGSGNEKLRALRNMKVDVLEKGILRFGSYGQTSYIDLNNWVITLHSQNLNLKYPITVNLVRDRENPNNPLVIESGVSRRNIENAMKLINLVHFVAKEFMGEKWKVSIRDNETPFQISRWSLQIDDSLINPTDLAKKETLDQILLDVRTNTSENPEVVARFLNDVFRAKYPQNTVNRGSTYVGLDTPISNKSMPSINTTISPTNSRYDHE